MMARSPVSIRGVGTRGDLDRMAGKGCAYGFAEQWVPADVAALRNAAEPGR